MYLCEGFEVQQGVLYPKRMNLTKKTQGHIAIFTASLIFGVNLPLTKTILPLFIDAQMMTLFRVSGAAILFWCVSLFVKKEPVPYKDLLLMFAASMFGIVINQFAFLEGLSRSSVVDTGIILTITPIVTMLFAALFLKEPITGRKILGVLVGLSGALLLILSGAKNGVGNGSWIGILLLLSSSFGFALYLTLFRDLIIRYSPITLMKWMFLFATIVGIAVYWRHITTFNFTTTPTMVYLKLAYIVVGATFFTYLLIPIAQKSLRPTTLSMYNYLQPIVAAFIVFIFNMDTFGWHKILSALLVFLGVYIVTQSKSREQVEKEQNHLKS